jgi:hypothetical protein
VAVCDTGIFLTRVGDPVVLQGVAFETVKRMLLTVNASTDAQPVTLIGCRFAADKLHDDRGMIVLTHAGPLTIIGGSYGDGDQRVPQIHLAGIGEQAVNSRGTKFGAFGAAESPLIRTNPGRPCHDQLRRVRVPAGGDRLRPHHHTHRRHRMIQNHR